MMDSEKFSTAFTDVYLKTTKSLTALLQAATTEYHTSFEQYQILHDIAHKRATNLTDLVRLRGVTKPAIARQLRTLRNLGYITQTTSTADRRRHLLSLTDKGKRVEKAVAEQMTDSFEKLLLQVGEDDLSSLVSILDKIDTTVLEPLRETSKLDS